MTQRTLTILAGLLAWWGIGHNVAQAQSWRLGTFGMQGQRSSLLPTRPIIDPNFGTNVPTMIAPGSIYQPGMIAPGTTGAQDQQVSQTGHPVTHFNYQRWFPLNYGTTSGNVVNVAGVTGIGGLIGTAPGTTGSQTGMFYSNQFSTNQINTLNAIQRGRR